VLLLENQQAFIDEVVPHELAHLLVWNTLAASRRTAKSGNG
jgi:predicted SprT family Zn-dependent metalloprotease